MKHIVLVLIALSFVFAGCSDEPVNTSITSDSTSTETAENNKTTVKNNGTSNTSAETTNNQTTGGSSNNETTATNNGISTTSNQTNNETTGTSNGTTMEEEATWQIAVQVVEGKIQFRIDGDSKGLIKTNRTENFDVPDGAELHFTSTGNDASTVNINIFSSFSLNCMEGATNVGPINSHLEVYEVQINTPAHQTTSCFIFFDEANSGE